MVDPFVLLTPVLVLAVVLLLGFAGCDVVFGLDPPKNLLKIAVGVPADLTVDFVGFRVTEPGATGPVEITSLDQGSEGPDRVVFSHLVTEPVDGTWLVRCQVRVTDASGTAEDTAAGEFLVVAGVESTARFDAFGSPANGNFRVRFVGLQQG